MGKVLSQDEVDSLLGGINDGKVETGTDVPPAADDVKAYDFSTPAGSVLTRLPVLKMINERLVGLLRKNLPIACRLVTDVNIASTDTLKFKEFCLSLPMPSSLNLFSMEPLRGYSLMVMEGPLVFTFVDSYFGGRGKGHAKLEGREFTPIETRIVRKVVDIVLDDMKQSWEEVHKVNTHFVRAEMDPQFAGIVTPDETVIVTKLDVHFENGSGTISICSPFSSFEPIKHKLKARFGDDPKEIDRECRRCIEKALMEMPLEIGCTIGKTRITGGDLMSMQIDDVIMLDKRVNDPVIITAGGRPVFKGQLGSSSKKTAVRINSRY